MKSIMFLSTEPYSGKTGLAVNMVFEFRERGYSAGYFKPVGNLPSRTETIPTDKDVIFAREVLGLKEAPDELCPLTLTSGETRQRLADGYSDAAPRIKAAYDSVLSDNDVLVLEGSGHINDGRLHGVSAVELTGLLDVRAVLVVKLDNPYEIVDDVLVARDRLGKRLIGVVFNWVNQSQQAVIRDLIVPFLAKHKIRTFGVMQRDERLLAITVDNLAWSLGGRIICAQEHGADMIETFMVGAMGQEQALRFFRRRTNKAVITGGDRADVQLAALETPTKCLVLTGNYMPAAAVLAVAEQKGVPIVLVDMDTLTAVDRTESLIGHMHIHDRRKLAEMRSRMEQFVDIEGLVDCCK